MHLTLMLEPLSTKLPGEMLVMFAGTKETISWALIRHNDAYQLMSLPKGVTTTVTVTLLSLPSDAEYGP